MSETANLDMSDILDRIHEASTLEVSIHWHEAMLAKLRGIIQVLPNNVMSSDELNLHRSAHLRLEITLAHLRLLLVNEERVAWDPERSAWVSSNVWQTQ